MSANSTIQVPNPYTQMAWVSPPDHARDLAIKLYAGAGAVAVLFWDILLHLPEDYKILRNFRINFLTVIFFFSRLSTMTFILGLTIVTTAPVGNCNLIRYVDFLYPLTIPLSVFPFVPRVTAIYNNNKYVFAFFMSTWLAVLATSILWPFGVQGLKIGPTGYCAEVRLHSTASMAALALFVHDSLIFLATSWAFATRSYSATTPKGVFKVLILGKNIPEFTRTILRDGQGYYLASLAVHVLFLSQYYASSPFAFPCSFGNPALVITTNMSAYVYRNIRLGFYRDHTVSSSAWDQAIDQPSAPSDRPREVSVMLPSTRRPGLGSVDSHEEKYDNRHVEVDTSFKVVEIKVDV